MTNPITPGHKARAHFPIFQNLAKAEQPFAYLDSASTSQKPTQLLERLQRVFTHEYANVRRGAYQLSAVATELYQNARQSIARFLGAAQTEQVIFTRGTTEGINLIARSFPFQRGDTVLLSVLEHHSNIVPWQLLAERAGVKLVFVDIDDLGRIDLDDFRAKLTAHRPRLVSLTHLSNALGSLSPVELLVKESHAVGARVLIDGAQAASHMALNVDALGMDYYVFSGHKVYGPTGIGVLYGKLCALEELKPFLGGGDMIATVSLEGSTFAALPHRFEAGTPSFPEAIALASAFEFIEEIGRDAIEKHEHKLLTLLRDGLSELLLSAISFMEFASLVSKGRLSINCDGETWIEAAVKLRKLRVIEITPTIAWRASQLPGNFHADPADRIIVSSTRIEQAVLITKDQAIRNYSHVDSVW
jgi:cysteine desulfurase/selenocysteine lyase